MRWRDTSPALPLQPVAALLGRLPQLAAHLPEPGSAGRVVLFTEAVRRAVRTHLEASLAEQGGLLLGEVYARGEGRDPHDSVFVLVRRAVPAADFTSDGFSLRMESAVWEQARRLRGPTELVVGWYHSHPGLGAFFSGTDRRTQAAFFAQPYSVGWVVDPVRGEEAVFVGDESGPVAGALALPADYGLEADGGSATGGGTTDGTVSAGVSTTSNEVT